MQFTGVKSSEVEALRLKYGSNQLTQIPPDPLWKKLLKGFKAPMLIILMVALVIQAALYFMGQAEWFEPAGILIAILIANGVAAISEHRQEGKAVSLREYEAAKDLTKVIRDGRLMEIRVNDVVTGEIVFLQSGDRVPADGILVDGHLKIDQAVLNGETEEIEKISCPDGAEYDVNDLLNPYSIYRGTVVCDYEAYMKVNTVGDDTLFGKLSIEAQGKARETPLQVKLSKLAHHISRFGYVGAIAIILAILIKTVITGESPDNIYAWIRLVIDAVMVAVTVIVCAVPEGLPMLTSILLSLQSIRMEKDNVLVKKINGVETSGSISMLFSDKTGTITEGKLSVAAVVTGDTLEFNPEADPVRESIILGIGKNNSAHYNGETIIGGNSTDRALMSYLAEAGMTEPIGDIEAEIEPFNSRNKYSRIILPDGSFYIKGAPEAIISRCSAYMDNDGEVISLKDNSRLEEYLDEQASRAMRLLAVAVGHEGEEKLTLVAIISIRDNIRPEAVEAIAEVQAAGIHVVMATGDRRETAVAIAKEAGLISSSEDVVITSAELAEKTDDEVKAILPRLKVIARALPSDKSRLVRLAQDLNYVVGMTGDGVNDSPALKKADVGFAMGSGTEVAKEAGDITILDDNFSSIAKAILYGRTMFNSIRKFLIFQLTVNVAAVFTCFLAPLLGENMVLTVIQLLLINLAMDTLAAIAFGSEPARKEFMREKPVARQASIVSRSMLAMVVINGLFITAICLSIIFVPPVRAVFGDVDIIYLKSALFATFMMAITFNGFNARAKNLNVFEREVIPLDSKFNARTKTLNVFEGEVMPLDSKLNARTKILNVFENLGDNNNFLLVSFTIFAMQFMFVEFGGEILSVEPLRIDTWLFCLGMAFMVIPLDIIRKILRSD